MEYLLADCLVRATRHPSQLDSRTAVPSQEAIARLQSFEERLPEQGADPQDVALARRSRFTRDGSLGRQPLLRICDRRDLAGRARSQLAGGPRGTGTGHYRHYPR